MKLIDLLVQELPKRGGWPEGMVSVVQSSIDGELYFYSTTYDGTGAHLKSVYCLDLCDEHFNTSSSLPCVTRDQYESALAASQKPAWSGEGLPPVGMHCEIVDPDGVLMYGQGESGEVIAHVENTAVIRMSYGLGCFEARFLRPARSEADKKRDAFIDAVLDDMRTIPCDLSLRDEVAVIYDAIAAGKIPGVKLDD